MLGWLKRWIAARPSTVMIAPGVLKTHNVECRFRREASDARSYYGKLSQDRWSDGQERFSLVLRNLPAGSEPVRLYRGGRLVSEFEKPGTKLEFRWKGTGSEEIPQFGIGEALRIECGELELNGIVEPD